MSGSSNGADRKRRSTRLVPFESLKVPQNTRCETRRVITPSLPPWFRVLWRRRGAAALPLTTSRALRDEFVCRRQLCFRTAPINQRRVGTRRSPKSTIYATNRFAQRGRPRRAEDTAPNVEASRMCAHGPVPARTGRTEEKRNPDYPVCEVPFRYTWLRAIAVTLAALSTR